MRLNSAQLDVAEETTVARLTDTQLRGLNIGDRKSEPVEGGGQLVAWRKKSGSKEFYFRKRRKGEKEINKKLGTYPDLALVTARKLASELAHKATQVIDLKFFLEQERASQKAAEDAAKKELQRQASLGTLSNLIAIYIAKMTAEGRSSAPKVKKNLERYVTKPFPDLAKLPANQITSDHIADILSKMIMDGITTTVNRIRGDLHAAFNVGLKYDYDPTLRATEGMRFDISVNPVARVPTQKKWERALSRNLSASDLHKAWFNAPDTMSNVYSALFRVMICTGFHPAELLRLKVGEVDLKEGSIYMIETKSKTPNLIPLNKYAMQEIEPFLNGRDPQADLFPSRRRNPRSDVYARITVVAGQVKKLRDKLEGVEHFTPRDIRRTVKTLMGKAGISKEIRDRLQNHAVSDVSGKHYDRYDYWQEKTKAMKRWERWLTANVIASDENSDNVVKLAR